MAESYGTQMRNVWRVAGRGLTERPIFVLDFLLKFLIIGEAGSGKSCILHYFIENKCTLSLFPAWFFC